MIGKECLTAAIIIAVSLANLPHTRADGANAAILIKPGQKVAFLGASISQYGWQHPTGYIRLVVANLAANGVPIVPIPAGVSGNTSKQMLARLDKDVVDKKPDWVTIDAGGNDVWHNSVQFDEYEQIMTTVVDKLQAAGIHVIIQTCTPIGEDLDNEFNPKLAVYNIFLRDLAARKDCVLADLNAGAVSVLQTKTGTANLLTVDGVHMNERGDRLMATGLLEAMGLTPAQIAKTIPTP